MNVNITVEECYRLQTLSPGTKAIRHPTEAQVDNVNLGPLQQMMRSSLRDVKDKPYNFFSSCCGAHPCGSTIHSVGGAAGQIYPESTGCVGLVVMYQWNEKFPFSQVIFSVNTTVEFVQ